MDKRKGLTRLAWAVCVPWFSFWGLVGWLGYSAYIKAQTEMGKDLDAGRDSMMKHWNETSAQGLEWTKNALLWGVAVPVLLLIVGLLAYWVYRGFKPNKHL